MENRSVHASPKLFFIVDSAIVYASVVDPDRAGAAVAHVRPWVRPLREAYAACQWVALRHAQKPEARHAVDVASWCWFKHVNECCEREGIDSNSPERLSFDMLANKISVWLLKYQECVYHGRRKVSSLENGTVYVASLRNRTCVACQARGV